MEMASRYEQQSLPIKLMTISNAEDVRRNSNRHPPVSATMSGPHSMYGGSNGKVLPFNAFQTLFLLHHSPFIQPKNPVTKNKSFFFMQKKRKNVEKLKVEQKLTKQ
jgi:hypothetical protein